MTWFKVDDGFWSHPKTLMLGPSAITLWVKAGTWSCQHLTDGFVPAHALPLFGLGSSVASELVDSGHWDSVKGGYEFHDWAVYQEPSGTVKVRREVRAEASAKANHVRWHERPGKVVSDCEYCSESGSESDPSADSDRNPPDPTRPDHSSSTKKSGGASRRKPETPMPDDWQPKPAHVKFALERGVDGRHEEGQFRAWVASKDVRYRDWDAAFRGWLGRANPSKRTPTQNAKRTVMLATDLVGELEA